MQTFRSAAESLGRVRRRALGDFGNRLFRATDSVMERASLVSGGPLYDPWLFPWIRMLEGAAEDIREELDAVLAHRDALPTFRELSPAQRSIADERWKVFPFYGFGVRADSNCMLCPRTARVLDAIPGTFNAFFSILAPGAHVPKHHGVTKGFLRCHLGLKVPRERDRCRMEIGGAVVCWEEGSAVVFDDCFPHEVWNDTDETRVVLLIDVPRPMRFRGRALLTMMMGALARTYYAKEPIANQRAWEERTRSTFATRAATPAEADERGARSSRAPLERAW